MERAGVLDMCLDTCLRNIQEKFSRNWDMRAGNHIRQKCRKSILEMGGGVCAKVLGFCVSAEQSDRRQYMDHCG